MLLDESSIVKRYLDGLLVRSVIKVPRTVLTFDSDAVLKIVWFPKLCGPKIYAQTIDVVI